MNRLAGVGMGMLSIGCSMFVTSIVGFVCASSMNNEVVSMPKSGCYTRLEGHRSNFYQTFNCRFIDPRVNEYVDVNYSPIQYQIMDSHPKNTMVNIEVESIGHRNVVKCLMGLFASGILAALFGLIAIVIGESTSSDKRW